MGGFSQSESENESQSFLPIQEQALSKFLESQSGAIGKGQKSFQGNRVAGFGDLQEKALALAPNAFFRTPEQEASLFKSGIEDPANRRFRQETVPLIGESFAGPGFFGSARAQETVRAGEDLASNLEFARSGLRQQTEDINRQGVSSLFSFGQAQQQQEQRQINADIEKFMEQTRRTNPEDAQLLLALLGMNFATSEGESSAFNFNVAGPSGGGGGDTVSTG
jgi:hypothetical protein